MEAKQQVDERRRQRKGAVRLYAGQRYDRIGEEDYQRKDGRWTKLDVYRSHCPECGKPFEIRASRDRNAFHPARRCDEHKTQGRRIRCATIDIE